MKCPVCGFENNNNVTNCISCGNQLTNTNFQNDKKFNEADLINPNIVEKTEIQSSADNLFGAQEIYTIRSNDTHNEVLNLYETNQTTEVLDPKTSNDKDTTNDEITMQELIDTVSSNNSQNIEEGNKNATGYELSNANSPQQDLPINYNTVSDGVHNENEVNIKKNTFFNIEDPEPQKEEELSEPKLVNPVAAEEEKPLNDKLNLFILIKLMIGAFVKPATTIKVNTRPYTKSSSSFKIYFFFSCFTFIAFMITNLVNSCFVKIYDININGYTTTFNINALQNVDYINISLIGILLTFGVTILTTVVYYIASFITNKGLSFGRYLSVITLCLLPFYLCTCVIGPLVSIPSYYLSVAVNFLGIIYSFIILITTLNELIYFNSSNKKIFYHTIILSIVFTIIGIVISIFLRDLLTALKLVL